MPLGVFQPLHLRVSIDLYFCLQLRRLHILIDSELRTVDVSRLKFGMIKLAAGHAGSGQLNLREVGQKRGHGS